MSKTTLAVHAHGEMLPLEAQGILNGDHVVLVLPDGKDDLSIRLRVKGKEGLPFRFIAPGSRCMVTLGIVVIQVEEIPDELPGLPAGLILKDVN